MARGLRERAEAAFGAAVAAADPVQATASALRGLDLGPAASAGGEVSVIAVGKAAFGMAEAATGWLDGLRVRASRAPGVLVVTHDEAAGCSSGDVMRSGHPLPDERGLAASREVERRAAGLGPDDLALVLISGGASALLPAPAGGIRLVDKLEATRQLLRAGATIHELNAVRKHLSALKGGGLLRRLRPARVVTLALSDVTNDDPSVIGSGPTAPDPSTFADAIAVLERCGVVRTCPLPVRERLQAGVRGELPETPKPGDSVLDCAVYRVVGGNRASVRAMAVACGPGTEVEAAPLEGEAREVGANLARRFGTAPPGAWVAGGETTVTVRGAGKGGRNQELALAFVLEASVGEGIAGSGAASALAADGRDDVPSVVAGRGATLPDGTPDGPSSLANRDDWVFLAAGTDGRDGPTDAAGAIVDATTIDRIRQAGIDPVAALKDNDSYRALDAADALLRTGATGTNVADVAVFLSGGGSGAASRQSG